MMSAAFVYKELCKKLVDLYLESQRIKPDKAMMSAAFVYKEL